MVIREPRLYDTKPDPIRPGWPPPMDAWSPALRAVFDREYADALAAGERPPVAFALAYGAVTLLPEGRNPDAR